jgi:pyruvate oxidase
MRIYDYSSLQSDKKGVDTMSVQEAVKIEKISGGFRVDGIELKNGKCGCTSLSRCCYSWSKIRRKGNTLEFEAKLTTPDTQDNFDWGYEIRKRGIVVKVRVRDARDKEIYSGFMPPPVKAWFFRGWEVIKQYSEREDGTLWRCAMCKWLYKEDIEGGPFTVLPEDWYCPKCKAPKSAFENIG